MSSPHPSPPSPSASSLSTASASAASASAGSPLRESSRERYERYQRDREERVRQSGRDRSKKRRSSDRSFLQLLGHFLRLARPERGSLLIALGTLTVATILRLFPPAATKVVIDQVLGQEPVSPWLIRLGLPADNRLQLMFWTGAAVIAASLFGTAIHLWGRWEATKAHNKMQVRLRRRVFEHMVRLPLHRVYQLKSGGTTSLLREDAGGVGELVFSMLYNPWRAIVQLAGSLLVLVFVDWRLLVGALFLLPVVYVTHRTWVRRIRPVFKDVRAQRQEVDGHATEAFGGMRIVRTFHRERAESGRFVRGNNLMVRQQLFVWWWSRLIDVIWETLIPVASTGLLLYGGYRVLQGHLTLGDLTMFLVYLAMLLGPIATLATSATMFQNQLAGLERVLDLLEEPLEAGCLQPGSALARTEVQGRIRFEHVGFRYPETDRLVLEGIDLEVQPGEMIALVGRSGAGKTTFCNLVARFYDPTEGRILVDGHDLRDVSLSDYRRLLGIVEQDVFLFDGTVADNIGYARSDASREQIVEAARAANAQAFIEQLPNGYETIIGERGVRLSGGQRQRLAIARAVLADPRILVLDEATSNLDSESERYIQESLARLMEGRTSFVIAHRLSTITHADRIVVLEQGKIVEVGSHAELMARSGIYRQMVELQTNA